MWKQSDLVCPYSFLFSFLQFESPLAASYSALTNFDYGKFYKKKRLTKVNDFTTQISNKSFETGYNTNLEV